MSKLNNLERMQTDQFKIEVGWDLQKGWVNDATCVQNSKHVDLFWVFDSYVLRDIHSFYVCLNYY